MTALRQPEPGTIYAISLPEPDDFEAWRSAVRAQLDE